MNARRSAFPIVVASGAALALAFPQPDLGPLALVVLAPFLWFLRGATPGRGFLLGFAFGLGFFSLLLFWISIVGYVAWVLLVLMQSTFIGLFGAGAGIIWRHRIAAVRVIGVTTLWVTVELARASFPWGGFTWGQLAQSQHDLFLWTLRVAAYGGTWMVAALVVGFNAVLVEAVGGKGRGRMLAALSGLLLLGAPLLLPVHVTDGTPLTVAIVQGSVPQEFSGSLYEKELAITRSHARLTRELDGRGLDLVVWPESSVGIDLERDPVVAAEVSEAARAVGVPMIVGGNLDIDAERYKVVVFLVSPEGEVQDVYQKTHLVPFGEYVPGRDLLGWIPMLDQVPRDAVPGAETKVFELPQGPIATVISFEGDFGSLVRRPIAAGGQALVVATNTSTWEHSWASAQHLAFSKVRAAENGVDVVHAAVSGTSGFIESSGELIEQTDLYETTAVVNTINFSPSRPFTPARAIGSPTSAPDLRSCPCSARGCVERIPCRNDPRGSRHQPRDRAYRWPTARRPAGPGRRQPGREPTGRCPRSAARIPGGRRRPQSRQCAARWPGPLDQRPQDVSHPVEQQDDRAGRDDGGHVGGEQQESTETIQGGYVSSRVSPTTARGGTSEIAIATPGSVSETS